MSANYRSDAEHSILRPAGPHLIEQSSDTVPQMQVRAEKSVARPYTVTVTTSRPAVRLQPEDGKTD